MHSTFPDGVFVIRGIVSIRAKPNAYASAATLFEGQPLISAVSMPESGV